MTAAALFDLDGTLIDSRHAVLGAYRIAAAQLPGATGRLAELPEGRLLAMRVSEVCEELAGPEHAEALAAAYDSAYRHETRHLVVVYDGVVEVLASLLADGVRLGIVTNKGLSRTPADLAPLDGAQGGAGLFDVVVTAADTVERKPSPRPIQHALEQTGWEPRSCVYVGDGPHDAESAHAAGLSFVGAGWGYYDGAALAAVGAEVVLDRVIDLADAVRRSLGLVPS